MSHSSSRDSISWGLGPGGGFFERLMLLLSRFKANQMFLKNPAQEDRDFLLPESGDWAGGYNFVAQKCPSWMINIYTTHFRKDEHRQKKVKLIIYEVSKLSAAALAIAYKLILHNFPSIDWDGEAARSGRVRGKDVFFSSLGIHITTIPR